MKPKKKEIQFGIGMIHITLKKQEQLIKLEL